MFLNILSLECRIIHTIIQIIYYSFIICMFYYSSFYTIIQIFPNFLLFTEYFSARVSRSTTNFNLLKIISSLPFSVQQIETIEQIHLEFQGNRCPNQVQSSINREKAKSRSTIEISSFHSIHGIVFVSIPSRMPINRWYFEFNSIREERHSTVPLLFLFATCCLERAHTHTHTRMHERRRTELQLPGYIEF